MPEHETRVFPFRGLRYTHPDIYPLNKVTAPPFDTISKPLQQTLYNQHPHNMVRLDLNLVTPEDSIENNAYTRARDYFFKWQQEGILIPDEQPAIYTYSHQWQNETGNIVERRGLCLLLEIEPYYTKRVFPHEKTLIGPKSDRMNLMKMTLGNFSPIFMVYADPDCTLEQMLFNTDGVATHVTDPEEITHTITAIHDKRLIQQVQDGIKHQHLLIADGHHRYETAIAFMEEARERYQKRYGKAPAKGELLSDYVIVYLANIHDPGLKVYPIHRLLHHWPEGFTQKMFEAEMLNHFDIVETNEDFSYWHASDLVTNKPPVKLRLKHTHYLEGLSTNLSGLDTAILEYAIFRNILNRTTLDLKASKTIGFATDIAQVQTQLITGQAVAAFLMKSPSLELIKNACEAGHQMPLKSTFFYPKLLNGLVFYSYAPFLNTPKAEHALSGVRPVVEAISHHTFGIHDIDHKMALIPD